MMARDTQSVILVPAYGRDYTNFTALVKDWDAGKDFLALAPDGSQAYTSKRDWAGKTVYVRCNKLTRLILLKG